MLLKIIPLPNLGSSHLLQEDHEKHTCKETSIEFIIYITFNDLKTTRVILLKILLLQFVVD